MKKEIVILMGIVLIAGLAYGTAKYSQVKDQQDNEQEYEQYRIDSLCIDNPQAVECAE